jgi:large subunit ribosomal protein L18
MEKSHTGRARRKRRIRGKISGSAERPRLTVFRSARHIYAQVVDDVTGATLAAATSHKKSGDPIAGTKTDAAKLVGSLVAQACIDKGIAKVVFDRNGYLYHGRVKALAESAREAGLQF